MNLWLRGIFRAAAKASQYSNDVISLPLLNQIRWVLNTNDTGVKNPANVNVIFNFAKCEAILSEKVL